MRLFVLAICFLLLPSGNLFAKMVHDIDLPETVTIAGESLQLNGYGLRKKYFFKIYLGSLYTREKATTTEQVLAMPGPKLIRMDFIHKKVDREKITQAFASGFANNSPQLIDDPKLEQFLNLFNSDFVAGDQVDIELAADGTVRVRKNSESLGEINSTSLVEAVLLVYLGDSPADTDLKKGLLGANQ